MFCPNCGKQIKDGSRFCDGCGAAIAPASVKSAAEKKQVPAAADENAKAPKPAPQAQAPETVPQGSPKQGPFKVIKSAVKGWFSSAGEVIRDPKMLIPALVLAGIWLILNILRACGITPAPLRALSFLTFAEGGLYGGIPGLIGGLLGKGMIACCVTSLFLALRRKEKREKAPRAGKETSKAALTSEKLWPFIAGAGVAVLIFLFISGQKPETAFMAGVAAAFLSLRDAKNGGLIFRVLSSFSSRGKIVGAVTGGMAAGFCTAALLGLTGSRLALVICGALLAIGGTVMAVLQSKGAIKPGKEKAQ